MGLFDKLFATSEKIEEQSNKNSFRTIFEKERWYLSQDAEDAYNEMSYVDRIDFITDYLLLDYYRLKDFGSLNEFEGWKNTFLASTIKDVCTKLSHLFVLFIISSKNLPFSGYKNALSRDVNPILDTVISSRYRINARKLIGSIHGKDYAPNNMKHMFDRIIDTNDYTSGYYSEMMNNLSSVDNEDLYILERAILSLYSDNYIINYYGVPKDI